MGNDSRLVVRGLRPMAIRTTPRPAGGAALDWWEDFRAEWTGSPGSRVTGKGLVEVASNATINRILKSAATGTWPSGITHLAENVYVANMNAAFEALNLWRQAAVGEFLFMRMLLSQSLPDGANTGGDHGFETNLTNPLPWFWRIWGGDANSFNLEFTTWDESGVDEFLLDAPKGTVLRLEWRAERTGAGTSQAALTVRVYNNETGALLGTHTGMTNATAAGGSQNPFRNWIFGMSGQSPTTYNGGGVFWGAIAARVSASADDWIGAYPVGPEA